ncbi:MAG: molybdenum cofactor biosynthesis protein MoaE [Candidatus Eremiobacterota bacterium]
MTVQVLLFASLASLADGGRIAVELPEGSTAEHLFAVLVQRNPRFEAYRPLVRVAVGEELVPWSRTLAEGDEVAFLPPVSGGTEDLVRLTEDPVSVDACLEFVRRPDCGAVVLFLGTVRNQTGGQPVDRLEYQAYAPMARKELEKLALEARGRWPLGNLALWHRHGVLGPGEVSVCVAVSAGHRAEAFEAGRWLIDTLKATVPLWKKEVGPEGEVWIEGDARHVQGQGGSSAC